MPEVSLWQKCDYVVYGETGMYSASKESLEYYGVFGDKERKDKRKERENKNVQSAQKKEIRQQR